MKNKITKFKDYQNQAITTKIYKEEVALGYLICGLLGELGEVDEKICNKLLSQESENVNLQEEINKEIGDVCWYIAGLCDELKIDTSEFDIFYNINSTHLKLSDNSTNRVIQDILLNSYIETSKISEIFKKLMRDDYNAYISHKVTNNKNYQNIIFYLKNIFINMCKIANINKSSIQYILEQNISKISSRKDRGKIIGSGDNR